MTGCFLKFFDLFLKRLKVFHGLWAVLEKFAKEGSLIVFGEILVSQDLAVRDARNTLA